jgi:hypothetical protein
MGGGSMEDGTAGNRDAKMTLPCRPIDAGVRRFTGHAPILLENSDAFFCRAALSVAPCSSVFLRLDDGAPYHLSAAEHPCPAPYCKPSQMMVTSKLNSSNL